MILGVLQGRAPASASVEPPLRQIPTELADGRSLGRADAPVTLEVWSDFQCPACGVFAADTEPTLALDQVAAGILRIEAHDAAFIGQRVGRSYDESVEAAAGARCAAEQNRFWPFHDYLYANQDRENAGAFSDERLTAVATAVGLDVPAWQACRDAGTARAAVREETRLAREQGIDSTPTLRIAGQTLVGAASAEDIAAIIRAAVPSAPAASPSPVTSPGPSTAVPSGSP